MQEQPKQEQPKQEQTQEEPLLPGQQPGLDPHGADKFNVHPKSVVWDDPEMQRLWEALHANGDEDTPEEEEGEEQE